MNRPRALNRRDLLKALAAGTAALHVPGSPLGSLVARGDGPPPKRLILLMQNNGTQQGNFWPKTGLSSPILDHLLKDPKTGKENGLRDKTQIIRGVYMPNDANGTNGNQHDMGFARMFTGYGLISRGGQPFAGGPSVDQIVAKAWGEESLTLAVLASETEPHPKPGFDHRESFSYLGPATLKHPRKDPLDVFRLLFPPMVSNVAHRQSVLDAVVGNLGDVARRLGTGERRKLDYHLTALRDVERRLKQPPMAACAARKMAPRDYLALDANALVSTDAYIPQLVDDMIDLVVQALACRLTRVATLQLGYGGGKWRFDWEGIHMNCHDDVAHRDIVDAGILPDTTRRLVLMNQYYARCVAKLATALDAIRPYPRGSVRREAQAAQVPHRSRTHRRRNPKIAMWNRHFPVAEHDFLSI